MSQRWGKWVWGITLIASMLSSMTGQARERSRRAQEIVLTPANTLVLRGEVASGNINQLVHAIIASPENKLYLYIDSFGGSIFAGLKLIEAIKASNKTIVCIANTAVSMAFVIFQSCDKRLIVEDAILMQHVASYGLEGQEPNNFTFASFLRRVVADLYKRQAKRIGLSEDEFYKKIRDDWWLWDSEAIAANAADAKVAIRCSAELSKLYVYDIIQVFIFQVKLKFNACPLVPGPIANDASADLKKDPAALAELNRALEKFNPRAIVDRRFTIRRNAL